MGEVRLKDGQISSVSEISRVTSCDECDGKQPNWYLSASSAKENENYNIIYKDVTVRVKGLPLPTFLILGCQTQVLIEHEVF